MAWTWRENRRIKTNDRPQFQWELRPVFLRRGAILCPVEGGESMTVYVDVLFALNAAINYLMLRVSARVAGAQMKTVRLLLAAALGGLYAVCSLLPSCAFLSNVLCKALVWAAMLVLAFGVGKKTIRLALLFLASSFAFGGVMFALVSVMGTGVMLLGAGAYYPVSAGALLVMAGVTYLISWLVFSRLGEHTGGEIVPLEIKVGERSVPIRALRDSGNTLKDPITAEPVLVVSWQIAQALFPQIKFRQADFSDAASIAERLAELEPAAKPRLIPYRAVGTQSGLLAAIRCEVVQNKKARPALAAFSPTAVSDAGTFEALTGG